jgi:hypothetical protein
MPGQYPAKVSEHGFWAVQSLVTEPGPAAAAIDRLTSYTRARTDAPAVIDVSAVARAAS